MGGKYENRAKKFDGEGGVGREVYWRGRGGEGREGVLIFDALYTRFWCMVVVFKTINPYRLMLKLVESSR